jgi:hypothetical protein
VSHLVTSDKGTLHPPAREPGRPADLVRLRKTEEEDKSEEKKRKKRGKKEKEKGVRVGSIGDR